MIRSPLLLLSACLVATQLAGCSTIECKSTHSAKSKSKPQETADDDADEELDNSWKYGGNASRASLASEEALDPWFGKYNYADKGREIERNLR